MLTGKSVPFVFDQACQSAFCQLKNSLCKLPFLAYPDDSKPFLVKCDASDVALGAVLAQVDDQGRERALAFASRSLKAAEKNYMITEKECLAIVWALKRWRNTLLGRSFVVYTDHRPLRWLFTKSDLSPKLIRWALSLAQYGHFAIEYHPGNTNVEADCMSRLPSDPQPKHFMNLLKEIIHVENPNNDLDETDQTNNAINRHSSPVSTTDNTATTTSVGNLADHEITTAQREDAWTFACLSFVSDPKSTIVASWPPVFREKIRQQSKFMFQDHNGILRRRVDNSNKTLTNNKKSVCRMPECQLVVPKSLVDSVLYSCHDAITAGHLGIEKTYHRIFQRYYWVGMWRDTRRWINQCRICQRRKPLPQRTGPLIPILHASYPFEMLGIDVLGGFKPSRNGYTKIIVATDYFSRFAIASPIVEETADSIAHFILQHVVCQYGAPRILLSDNGSPFTAHANMRLYHSLGIEKRFTTPYMPNCNGLTERFNRTLCSVLASYVSPEHDDWCAYIQMATFAYNTSYNHSVQDTPFYIVYGRDPPSPADIILSPPNAAVANNQSVLSRVRDWRDGWLERHRDAVSRVQAARQSAAAKQAKYFDKYVRSNRFFTPNSRVWIYNPAAQDRRSGKLDLKWTGPHTVVKHNLDSNTVKVNVAGSTRTVNASYIRPYFDDQDFESESSVSHTLTANSNLKPGGELENANSELRTDHS